jgi:hypothetical protein
MVKKIFITFVAVLIYCSQLAGHPRNTPVTRLISPDGSKPLSYREWKEKQGDMLSVSLGNVGITDSDGGKINLIVNSSLYGKLTNFLNPATGQFVVDLTNAGWSVSIDTMSSSSYPFAADTLRQFLIDEYNTGSKGAILIGDLPIAWFQMMNTFYGSVPEYTDFPIDLFYMDMDGVWADHYEKSGDSLIPGSDSIYDTHTGNMGPEIFVGRLTSSTVGNDSLLLYSYFQRNHNFRVDSMNLSKEALFYIDDDWIDWSGTWSSQLGAVYDSILVVDHPETTIADDYRARIGVSHEWISLHAHSWPQGHAFKYDSGGSWSWFYSSEIPSIDPVGNFYNLFACSNARYTETDFCAGMYAFRTSYGLGALGSTKTGSMLEFQYFYNPLADGNCLGDAFSQWFEVMGEAWGDTSRSWFYGMTLIGDPTLSVVDSSLAVAESKDINTGVKNLVARPNPATDYVEFAMEGNRKDILELKIVSIDGRVVWNNNNRADDKLIWNCSKFPAGIYFYMAKTKNSKFSDKIIIVK